MNAPFRRRYRLLALITTLVALALYMAPAPAAQAQASPPDWYAWHFKVSFPGPSPQVIMTSYWGTEAPSINQPVSVTGAGQIDISGFCTIVGNLPIAAGTATFNGSSYIRCRLPSAEVGKMGEQCSASNGPFFWSALRGTITPGSTSNPIFTLSDSASRTPAAAFALPSNGGSAKSRQLMPLASYTSTAWSLSPVENRVLMGSDGVSIQEIAKDIENYVPTGGWLSFMGAINVANRLRVSNWAEQSGQYWQTSRSSEGYLVSDTFDIGYNPFSGATFAGTMSDGEFDPPGCLAK